MVIKSTLPAFKLKEVIESTGRQAVLKGFGVTNAGNNYPLVLFYCCIIFRKFQNTVFKLNLLFMYNAKTGPLLCLQNPNFFSYHIK